MNFKQNNTACQFILRNQFIQIREVQGVFETVTEDQSRVFYIPRSMALLLSALVHVRKQRPSTCPG